MRFAGFPSNDTKEFETGCGSPGLKKMSLMRVVTVFAARGEPEMRIFLTSVGAIIAPVFHPPVFAQAGTAGSGEVIDEIVVEGTRLGQLAAEIGTSVSIIDSGELEALGFNFAVDALAAAPGVTINQNGAFGGLASVRIRGAASEQTLVLVDGVPVNDPSSPGGGYNFARFDSGLIERIEILKGPQSSLWGSDAIGGVVSIVTSQPEPGTSGSVYADYGSFAMRHGGASVGHAGEAGDFRLSGTVMSSDGISKADEANGNSEKDGFESRSLSAKGGLDLAGGARLQANLLTTTSDSDFDSFSFGAQGSVADGDENSEAEEITANVSLTLPALDGMLEHLFLTGYSAIDRQNFSAGASTFSAEGRRAVFRYQGTWSIDESNTLAFGAEREQLESSNEDLSIDGLFAVHEFKPAANVTLTGGVRSDRHQRFGSELTARLGAAVDLNPNLILRASWGNGFKAPTLFQSTFFCCGATEPNSGLKPESSSAVDAGFEWAADDGRALFGLTAFSQSTENMINFSFTGGGYENIAMVDSTGVEIHGGIALSASMRLNANYAFIDATDGAGDPLIRIPRHSGDLSLDFNAGGAFSGRLLLRHNGSEPDRSVSVGNWTRFDLSGRYRISERVEVFARLENLLDEHYQQILGYGTPGRSGSIGARMRF